MHFISNNDMGMVWFLDFLDWMVEVLVPGQPLCWLFIYQHFMYILNFDQYIQVADRIFGRLTCWHFNKLQATHSTHILGEVSQSTTRHVQMPTTNRTALPVRTAASLRPSPDQPAPMKHSWSTSNKNYAQTVSIGKFLLPILTLRISTAVCHGLCLPAPWLLHLLLRTGDCKTQETSFFGHLGWANEPFCWIPKFEQYPSYHNWSHHISMQHGLVSFLLLPKCHTLSGWWLQSPWKLA